MPHRLLEFLTTTAGNAVGVAQPPPLLVLLILILPASLPGAPEKLAKAEKPTTLQLFDSSFASQGKPAKKIQ